MVLSRVSNFSGAPIRPARGKRSRPSPFLNHTWRFLTREETHVPLLESPRLTIEESTLESLVQSRVEARLESSLGDLPDAEVHSVVAASAVPDLNETSASQMLKFGAPSHSLTASWDDQSGSAASVARLRARQAQLSDDPNVRELLAAADRGEAVGDDRLPKAGDYAAGKKRFSTDIEALTEHPKYESGPMKGLERLRAPPPINVVAAPPTAQRPDGDRAREPSGPPAPIIIWRPPETIRIAADIPWELTKPEAKYAANMARVKLSTIRNLTSGAGLSMRDLVDEERRRAANGEGTRSASPVRPHISKWKAQKLKESKRSSVAIEYLRMARAIRARAEARPPVRVDYGKWYVPCRDWRARPKRDAKPSSEDAPGAAAERDHRAEIELSQNEFGEEVAAQKQHEKEVKQEIAKAYISKQFKQYIDDHDYRMPMALDPLSADTGSLTGFDRNMLQHMLPALRPLLAPSMARLLRRELQGSCLPPTSTYVPVSIFREVLARHGFRFTEVEYSQLTAIAPADELGAPATKRHAKIDYNLFMVRCSEAIRKARLEGAKKHTFVEASADRAGDTPLSDLPELHSVGGLSDSSPSSAG